MRYALGLFLTLLLLVVTHNALAANPRVPSSSEVSCKTELNDLHKVVVGKGANLNAARADASNKCFDHRLSYFQNLRKAVPSGEQADLMIEQCVNIKCL